MATRWYLTAVALCTLLATSVAQADIYRWDTGEVIPGTEEIELGPGVKLDHMELEVADLQDLDLTAATLDFSNLRRARMIHSVLTDASLIGAYLWVATMTDADLSSADLSNARAGRANIANADLTGANLTYANFGHARLKDANLTDAILNAADLTGAVFLNANLTRASLVAADLLGAMLGNADLTGANLRLAYFRQANLESAVFSQETVYDQWTLFPIGFDPVEAGLTFVLSAQGDFDGNDELDDSDVDLLSERNRHWKTFPWKYRKAFDLNGDEEMNHLDHRFWVKNLKNAWFGDANLDGEFSNSDMVQVFAAGKYERESVDDEWGVVLNPVSWSEGDWNGDGNFDSGDMVTAFVDGGYEKGPMVDAAVVPEPSGWSLLVMSLLPRLFARRSRRPV